MVKITHSSPPKAAITLVKDGEGSGNGTVTFVEPNGITGGATGPITSSKAVSSDSFGPNNSVYTVKPVGNKTWADVQNETDLVWTRTP